MPLAMNGQIERKKLVIGFQLHEGFAGKRKMQVCFALIHKNGTFIIAP